MDASRLTSWRPTRPRTSRDDTAPVPMTAERERWHFLATYYAWLARRNATPGARDPLTGRAWPDYGSTNNARRLGRAAHLAMAREAYAIARALGPDPLP